MSRRLGALGVAWLLGSAGLLSGSVLVDAAGPFDPAQASPLLARAPYLTDLSQTSVQVTWATTNQGHGTLRWGTPGSCTENLVTAGTFRQVNVAPTGSTLNIYQDTMTIPGLSASTSYCYRVYAVDGTDLLGQGNPSPTFRTLDPVSVTSQTPLTFAVVGDFGDNTDCTTGTVSPTSFNTCQQAIDAGLASSGVRFVVGVGDMAYQDGSQSNYGDLHETGTNAPGGTTSQLSQISNIFGPSYWAQIQDVPFFAANGNHGRNSNILTNWPEDATTAASGGTYAMTAYPAMDGANAATYPATWYAFSSGNVRVYVLDASWADSNIGSGNGSLCGTTNPCGNYQLDHDQHWTTSSPEYLWLKNDLESHPGGVKFAMFHYPLRADNAQQQSDPYLQASPSNPDSLEALLSANGVGIVFNGHAHFYQRNVKGAADQVISYVTGGGGGRLQPVGTGSATCSATNAYAIGWSFSSGGSKCGAAQKPTSSAQVYHFIKVTVAGTQVTVAPQNALGQTFDVQTYDFGGGGGSGSGLSEDFESGTLGAWSPVVGGVTTQSSVTHAGTYAAQVTSSGEQSYALRGLAAPAGELWAQAWVWLPSAPTTSATLFGLKSPTRQVIAVYLRPGGIVTVRNNVTGVNYQGQTVLSEGSWHRVVLHASIAGGGFDVTVDGVPDSALTQAGQDLGAEAFTTFQLGDDATGRTFTFDADDLLASTTPLPTDPPPPSPSPSASPSPSPLPSPSPSASPSPSPSPSASPPGPVFVDGFESGTLDGWQPVVGVTVSGSDVHGGAFATSHIATKSKSYALHPLPSAGFSALAAEGWFSVASVSTSATLFGLRNSSAQVIQLYVGKDGRVRVRNSITGVNYTGTAVVASGSGWHRIALTVDETAGTFAVAVDGVTDGSLSKSGQNLGTLPMVAFQLGDDSKGRTFRFSADDISVSTP
jgi:hypothetical protein